ncbi:Uncharacterised protein [uncultured Clostridium sp.]|nr:Uncharacterised protein [uncultured Clostridium sp.]
MMQIGIGLWMMMHIHALIVWNNCLIISNIFQMWGEYVPLFMELIYRSISFTTIRDWKDGC